MRREILEFKRMSEISGCCPGHDTWPVESYKSRTSKKARSRDKGKEHRVARHISNAKLLATVCDVDMYDEDSE